MAVRFAVGLVALSLMVVAQGGAAHAADVTKEKKLRLVSEQTVGGFTFPESVAYDPKAKVLYVSQFGGTELKPAEKDGNGKISKVSLSGKVLEDRFLPPAGEKMNKPKGIWVEGNRLWVTDIDVVWVFDLKTRKGRKLEIPGITFANDPAVIGNSLYVSDNRADRVYRSRARGLPEPRRDASDQHRSRRQVDQSERRLSRESRDRFSSSDSCRPKSRAASTHSARTGSSRNSQKTSAALDGVYQMQDGSILATEWNSGSLVRWTEKSGMETLTKGFKGPADFAVAPDAKGLTVFIPDLPASQLRIVRLGR